MTETQSGNSPLARLVLFIVCLAIAGSFVAGLHYYTVDLPVQEAALAAPANQDDDWIEECQSCIRIFCGDRFTPYCERPCSVACHHPPF